MAKASYIGLITCPICGNENATVHQQETGTKKGRKYYRCYQTVNGSAMRCGTIQCIGEAGQVFINANLRPIGQPEQAPEPPKPIQPEPEPIGQPEPSEVPPMPEPEPIGQPEPVPIEQPTENEPEPVALPEKRSVWAYLTKG